MSLNGDGQQKCPPPRQGRKATHSANLRGTTLFLPTPRGDGLRGRQHAPVR